jgi:hypothetical protein
MMMKGKEMLQFALFCCENYYPEGGWKDFQGTFATLEEATAAGRAYQNESFGRWYHVVDLSIGSVVEEN